MQLYTIDNLLVLLLTLVKGIV